VRSLFESVALDADRRELLHETEPVPVEPQVFDLLLYLIRNRGRVVTKDDLLASVWRGRIVSESALSTRINAARVVLGDSGEEQRFIKTLSRRGLRFVAAVCEEPDAAVVRSTETPSALPDKPSIAVLPFENLSGDPGQDYLTDGIVEDITTALSRNRAFFVIARNSSGEVDRYQAGRAFTSYCALRREGTYFGANIVTSRRSSKQRALSSSQSTSSTSLVRGPVRI
jgi:DNA-binding winged helix-turn-helix (wHTH) protein